MVDVSFGRAFGSGKSQRQNIGIPRHAQKAEQAAGAVLHGFGEIVIQKGRKGLEAGAKPPQRDPGLVNGFGRVVHHHGQKVEMDHLCQVIGQMTEGVRRPVVKQNGEAVG